MSQHWVTLRILVDMTDEQELTLGADVPLNEFLESPMRSEPTLGDQIALLVRDAADEGLRRRGHKPVEVIQIYGDPIGGAVRR